MQQALVDLVSQQPSHLLVAELGFCLVKPSLPQSQAPCASGWPHCQLWGGAIGSDLAYLSTLVRDGHSRGRPLRVTVLWLSVHPLPDQCLYPLHPNSHGWPSSVLAPGKYSSTAFPGNQGANLMSIPPSITCNLPLNPRTKPAYLILSAVRHTLWGVAPGPCFRLVSSPVR